MAKHSGSSSDLDFDTLIHLADNSFRTNAKCDGCGTCEKVCPVENICITDGVPVWLNDCENCLACYNFCPKKAIESGIVNSGYFYINPEINVKEIIDQKNKKFLS